MKISSMADIPDITAALQLFDETTQAMQAQVNRLEQVLTAKQEELQVTNTQLAEKVDQLDRLHGYLHTVMSAVASGVIACNREGVITTYNPAAQQALSGAIHLPEQLNYRDMCPDNPRVADVFFATV